MVTIGEFDAACSLITLDNFSRPMFCAKKATEIERAVNVDYSLQMLKVTAIIQSNQII